MRPSKVQQIARGGNCVCLVEKSIRFCQLKLESCINYSLLKAFTFKVSESSQEKMSSMLPFMFFSVWLRGMTPTPLWRFHFSSTCSSIMLGPLSEVQLKLDPIQPRSGSYHMSPNSQLQITQVYYFRNEEASSSIFSATKTTLL